MRSRFWVRDCLDGRGTIVRADSRGDAAGRIHGDGEIGPVHFPVLCHHPLEPELFRPLVCDRHADEAAAVGRHEVDCFRGRLFRRHDEVAFVLAIRVVGYDDQLSLGDIADHVFDCVELKCLGRFGDHWPLSYARSGCEQLSPRFRPGAGWLA